MNIRIYDSNVPGQVISPMLVNSYSALTIPAYYRAIKFLTDNLASFDRSVYKDESPAAPQHPLDKLLMRRPNRYQDVSVFWRTLFYHGIHKGNGYARIERTGTFDISGLHNLLPEEICPFRYDRDGKGMQQYYLHRPTKSVILAADMLHLVTGLSYDGMCGMDPVAQFSQIFQQAGTHSRYMTMFLQRGTVLRGAIEVPTGVSEEAVLQIQNTLRTYFSGADAERDVIVLSDGAKLNNATLSPHDSQLVEQGAYTTKQIAQITGVPLQFLFEMADQKFNNSVEQIGQDVVRFTFRPLIEQIEDQLSLKLLTEAEQDEGYRINIDPSALLRGSTKEEEDIANSSVNAGLRTRNEGRAIINLPPDKDPESDKLKVLGDTAAPPTKPEKTNKPAPLPVQENPLAKKWDHTLPILEAYAEKIDAKTDKAFSGVVMKKPDQERTIWANVFAGEQEKYVGAAFAPISEGMVKIGLPALDVAKIAESYSAGIRKRAATGELTTLKSILEGVLPTKPN